MNFLLSNNLEVYDLMRWDDDKFVAMFNEQPSLINSLRDDDDKTFLMKACMRKDVDEFSKVLAFEPDLSCVENDGWNVLHCVGFISDDVACEMLSLVSSYNMNETKQLLNKKDKHGHTPLYLAARKNHHRRLEMMLTMGGDVNIKNNYGELPDDDEDCDDETKRLIRKYRER